MATDPFHARFGREFPVGEVLFREGEPGRVMYVIQRGRVRISKRFHGGDRTLSVLSPGDFFGEMALLSGRPRGATATVVEHLHALEIDVQTFETMIHGNGDIAVRMITRLARRLDSANAFLDILLERDPTSRVLLALARNAEEYGHLTDDGWLVALTVRELAAQVDLEPEAVLDEVNRLTRVRLIRPTGDERWLVPDPQDLHAFHGELVRQRAQGGL